MKSVMSHSFASIPQVNLQRSKFNRSHGYKTTFDASYLVPVFVDEVLPGDTMNLSMTAFARLATPLTPFMDNLFLDSFFFAVPYRLVWSNWQKFNGEQDNPGDSTVFTFPIFDVTAAPLSTTGWVEGSLADYFGIPTKVVALEHSSLWHRAYNLIYNQWFRDENLINSKVVDVDDGPDTPAAYVLLKRGKRRDYFTSCLPWPQKGTAVEIPLGTTAPIVATGSIWWKEATGARTGNMAYNTGTVTRYTEASGNLLTGDVMQYHDGLEVDLSTATAATINSLREAFQLQKMFERDARGGTRYIELIRSHFGVISPDARLQRPEYIGGGTSMVNVHPIANTTGVTAANSPTGANKFQGDLSAMATVTASGHGFVKSFTEHCLLIGLINVRADLTYCQGLNRMFSRTTRYDFFWPSLANIGEQAVLNKEIYCQGPAGGTNDDDVFGYIPRYDEYRFKPSQLTGLYRFNATGTLETWHLAQEFGALPALADAGVGTFITDDAPVDRVIAVPAQPHFLFDSYFNYTCVRPMPTYSVPGLIDHF